MRETKGTIVEYGTSIALERPHALVVEQVRAALKDQGFGVLTEIDVQATLREKLGEDTGP